MSSTIQAQRRSPWFPYTPSGTAARARLRLLCFPCSGQGASAYRAWQRVLAPDIDVVPVQLPGREGRAAEPPYSSMDSLMEELLPELREQVRDTDGYALFGHSLGALVAFEAARRLEATGPAPRNVLVAAQRPPHLPLGREPLHVLPRADLLDTLSTYGQMPVELFDDPAAVEQTAKLLRADLSVLETYRPAPGPGGGPDEPPARPLLSCPVTALPGLADITFPPGSMRAWGELTSGPFTFRPVPGGHFFVGERTEELAGLIRAALG
ncbi:thioesterase [Streptomyces oryzae]|uniref:Thioesterase n=1 Tax=Streptomyces oryzae TaxID=1434886 RepID=A0ABS3XAS9_9ACTN|nr:alpha/beta fold hydrolase [Streptomyces oryzae]MBO8192492.1 thioesterase [Streptomyces oryzae]